MLSPSALRLAAQAAPIEPAEKRSTPRWKALGAPGRPPSTGATAPQQSHLHKSEQKGARTSASLCQRHRLTGAPQSSSRSSAGDLLFGTVSEAQESDGALQSPSIRARHTEDASGTSLLADDSTVDEELDQLCFANRQGCRRPGQEQGGATARTSAAGDGALLPPAPAVHDPGMADLTTARSSALPLTEGQVVWLSQNNEQLQSPQRERALPAHECDERQPSCACSSQVPPAPSEIPLPPMSLLGREQSQPRQQLYLTGHFRLRNGRTRSPPPSPLPGRTTSPVRVIYMH